MYFGHVAIYTHNLKAMADWYCKYFDGKVIYTGSHGDQDSIYVGYDEHCYMELMDKASVPRSLYGPGEEREGLTHVAINVESTQKVRDLTAQLEADGYTIIWQPTDYGGNRFYESCVLDPDGNRVEICVHEDILKAEREAGLR